ncbi:(2Fe-2S)-binding protein [Paraburkholderia caffeinilytica]|uniref:Rieske iron-sulfur protein n=1 Tax=Paraburkholderia caffeinilytica TaxID=1761016 RepID=A0ABQ1LNB2_9BURK|nr:Rieske 2Fe-2S domain-containing protein [Paraburkholderia caffeinilytica]AXL53687.1 (2Fe-2S)-binding protein [Paraburkholderia caffeinilytica]GGC26964.1 Rieske iron-sulfur protein [Paraburkholderia caffeinilytica]CAB3779944.1 hypothetical protein LMG28690_00848 [Paraburkholderia caffeinilytica]
MNTSNEAVVLPMRFWDHRARGRWWPLALSEQVSGEKPIGRMCAGEPVVLFRDRTGTARALEDRCPHRRAPLSLGRMTPEGRLQCGYHGWTYEGETGACTAIPNLSDTERVPARYGARTWQVIERDGFVFVRAGDATGFEASTVVERAPEQCAHPFFGSAIVSLHHEDYVAALADAPHLLMSIAGLRVTDYVTSDPRLRSGRVTMERGVVPSRRRVNHRFVTDYPFSLQLATTPGATTTTVELRSNTEQLVLWATLATAPAARGTTAVHWRGGIAVKARGARTTLLRLRSRLGRSPLTLLNHIDGTALSTLAIGCSRDWVPLAAALPSSGAAGAA